MKYHFYCITCITNLHAGSNGESHAIIDKTVQRDVSTGLPTIFSSSLKGALREHFEAKFGEDSPIITHLFGPKPKRSEGDEAQGKYRFFSANLLSLPVRSNVRPFYRTTCKSIINDLLATNTHFDLKLSLKDGLQQYRSLLNNTVPALVFDQDGAVLEDDLAQKGNLPSDLEVKLVDLFGENTALMQDKIFMPVAQKMPVIARNQLENGISENLWYEEVVPRQTRFYTIIGVPDNDPHWEATEETLKELIQIGGNATIGYGQTKFTPLT